MATGSGVQGQWGTEQHGGAFPLPPVTNTWQEASVLKSRKGQIGSRVPGGGA